MYILVKKTNFFLSLYFSTNPVPGIPLVSEWRRGGVSLTAVRHAVLDPATARGQIPGIFNVQFD